MALAFEYPGINPRKSHDWRRIPARPRDRYFLGLDIGQSIDPSAICVLHHKITAHDTWTPNADAEYWKQDRTERFFVRHLERLPLQTPYPEQIQIVTDMLARPQIKDNCTFVLDFTGVGRPCADMFRRAGLNPECVLIMAGNDITRGDSGARHVPKQILISELESRLHSGELKIAAKLQDAGPLADELKNFARKVSDAGRVTFAARGSSNHDDLVLAVAIALFAACEWAPCISEPLNI